MVAAPAAASVSPNKAVRLVSAHRAAHHNFMELDAAGAYYSPTQYAQWEQAWYVLCDARDAVIEYNPKCIIEARFIAQYITDTSDQLLSFDPSSEELMSFVRSIADPLD